ncbi:MAG TPA: hypothetical protein VIE69_05315 [Methylophilaceae bacterium]|jgi:predicted CopG family antitoxin
MHTIEIDFDVFKRLTLRRETEDVSYNDVLRLLLGLPKSKLNSIQKTEAGSTNDWVAKSVRFPAGTEFRGSYKGQVRTGRVENGALVVNATSYDSPSAAAMAITGNPVNGWRFWECRFPGQASWKLIESLRN